MDVMNLDSQLMEAIHKKIELSQQLERWEIDLETLIEMQVRSPICLLIVISRSVCKRLPHKNAGSFGHLSTDCHQPTCL